MSQFATNPFNPTLGDVPKVYLDTDHRAEQLIQKIKSSEFARSFFITGVRGSGKTAFMTQVENQLSQDQRYLIAVCGHKTFKAVTEQMGVSKSYASQYRRRAIAGHLVRPATYGKVEYTLPYFRDFIMATQNPDSMYYYPVN